MLIFVGGTVNQAARSAWTLGTEKWRLVALNELDLATFTEPPPEVVVTDLVAKDHDCLDVATVLASLEYTGRLVILAPRLPRPEIVQHEVAQRCPWIDVDIVTL